MSRSRVSSLGVAVAAAMATLPSMVATQESGWIENQVNATMCYWKQARGVQMRDAAYMDGGNLYWVPGLSNGTFVAPEPDRNPEGFMFALNFSKSFHISQNMSTIFDRVRKGQNNIAPPFFDGGMFANNAEIILYGGMSDRTDAYDPPLGNEYAKYQQYLWPNVENPSFRPGLVRGGLPDGITRYVAYGASASAPSENKAWYFSGMRSPTNGLIFTPGGGNATRPQVPSDKLISVDMAQLGETWRNESLPDDVKGRAGAEMVWVPYGPQGMLMVIGGVTHPEFISVTRQSSNKGQSEFESRQFMETIDVYDIAGGKWYKQKTSSPPPAYARGCAVVAPAQDYSSVSIYWYGGYNGVDYNSDFNDDVWLLSVPSFMWMKMASGRPSHARAGHKCFMPYPDQMFVVGGYQSEKSGNPPCLDKGIVQVLNLTSTTWMDSYDPAKWDNYGVPEHIQQMIGGNAAGGATMKTPDPSGWQTSALGEVFATPYPTTKLSTYYPYASVGPGNNTNPDLVDGGGGGGGGGVPNWVPIVVGVIGGLILITSIAAAVIVWRRRHLLRRNAASAAGGGAGDMSEAGNSSRIRDWMRGQPSEHKALTVSGTDDAPFSPDLEHNTPVAPHSMHPLPPVAAAAAVASPVHSPPAEMADTQVAELMDTSPPIELQDTALTPVEIINKHTHFAQQQQQPFNGGSVNSSGYYSSLNQTDQTSTISSTPSGLRAPPNPAQAGAVAAGAAAGGAIATGFDSGSAGRADSPPLGTPGFDSSSHQQQQQQQSYASQPRSPTIVSRLESGVSGISEGERRHLRQISDETVSSFSTGAGVMAPPPGVRASPHQHQHQHPPTLIEEASPVSGGTGIVGPGGLHPLVGTPPLVSPPSAGLVGDAEDYLSARPAQQQQQQTGRSINSPLRRSVFREHDEDLGERH